MASHEVFSISKNLIFTSFVMIKKSK